MFAGIPFNRLILDLPYSRSRILNSITESRESELNITLSNVFPNCVTEDLKFTKYNSFSETDSGIAESSPAPLPF